MFELKSTPIGVQWDPDSFVFFFFLQPEKLDPGEPMEDNHLSVRKPTVGRTHSLPNDSYMFHPLQPFGHAAPAPAQLLAQSQRPQHILGTHRAQSGNAGYLCNFEQLSTISERCSCFLPEINTPTITLLLPLTCQHCARLRAGSSGSVRSQPEDLSQKLTVPTDLFRPISPHSHSDSESIPRLPPPRRTHTLSRTLRRQVNKSYTF